MKEIQLTQGKVALVDDEDFEYLSQWKWHAKKGRTTYYAVRTVYVSIEKKFHIKMNRQILELTNSKVISDHIDRNGLNNQRSNLRIANYSQNGANAGCKGKGSSLYLGVSWQKNANKWSVKIKKNYKSYHFGLFDNEKEAAIAYNKAAIKMHGEFANLNKITA